MKPQLKKDIIKLRLKGLSIRQIAKRLGKGSTTIFYYLKSTKLLRVALTEKERLLIKKRLDEFVYPKKEAKLFQSVYKKLKLNQFQAGQRGRNEK